jgi:hypothetical protein
LTIVVEEEEEEEEEEVAEDKGRMVTLCELFGTVKGEGRLGECSLPF